MRNFPQISNKAHSNHAVIFDDSKTLEVVIVVSSHGARNEDVPIRNFLSLKEAKYNGGEIKIIIMGF